MFAFYTNSVSPHQLPLAQEFVRQLGENEYRYIYTTPLTERRRTIGWNEQTAPWIMFESNADEQTRNILRNSRVVMSGIRDMELFKRRADSLTIYCSERWFKPWAGILRLLKPSYFIMARCFVKMLSGNDRFVYFPTGIHAAGDMARLCGIFHGDLRCLFRPPQLEFEQKPGGRIWLKYPGDGKMYCVDKMRMWGYFVAPSGCGRRQRTMNNKESGVVRLLWVGRIIGWKCVNTLVRAVARYMERARGCVTLPPVVLDIYGSGKDERRIRKKAQKYGDTIRIHPPVSICEVRVLMQSHDIYVLPSNAVEGWGAVVNEALEEGMQVLGTYEAGSSATMLPHSHLYHAGDVEALVELISKATTGELPKMDIGLWSARLAARQLFRVVNQLSDATFGMSE